MPYTEEEKKEYKKQYYQKNKEKILEHKKEYYKKNKEHKKEYYKKNKEKVKESGKEYREQNKEKRKEYDKKYKQLPEVKKRNTISEWVNVFGLKESKENLDRIYHLRETQELCNACDIKLTRNGDRSSTEPCMDHDHETGRFRHIICRSCNSQDKWKKYFC